MKRNRTAPDSLLSAATVCALVLCALVLCSCGKGTDQPNASKVNQAGNTAPDDDTGGDEVDSGDHNVGGGDGAVSGKDAAAPTASGQLCTVFGEPFKAGQISNTKLDELSGLAASWRHPTMLWSHNDSGEKKPRIFAIDTKGQHVATYKLKGVNPIDWEDIAVGPCAGSGPTAALSCVYVGDVGDNGHERGNAQIHRVAEPDSLPPAGDDPAPRRERFRKSETETFYLKYPKVSELKGKARDEAEHPDVEAMAVMPDARVVLLSKRNDGKSTVFRVDLSKAKPLVERMGELALSDKALKQGHSLRVTSADLDKTGRWLLVRTYFRIYLFDMGKALFGDPIASAGVVAQAPRQAIEGGLDLQGESIAWAHDGGFWHTSEGVKPPLWRIPCTATK
jgi:hypothetical protein